MANKNKLTSKPKDAPLQTPPSAPLVNLPIDPTATGKVQRAIKRAIDNGIETAINLIWLWVIGVMITTAIAIWLLLTSGHPLVKYAAAYVAGWFSVLLLILFFGWIKSRRLEALEQAKTLKFVSKEKGFLDFIVNKQKSEVELDKILRLVGKEIDGVGKAATRFGARVNPATPFEKRKRLATKVARIFGTHSGKLERLLESFEEINSVVIESNTGLINWLDPANVEHEQALVNSRQTFNDVLDNLRPAIVSIDSLRKTVANQKGTSQDLNTAVARMAHVLNGHISEMRKSEKLWEALIRIIDRKLNS